MSTPKRLIGVRSLSSVCETSPPGRLLDLHALVAEMGRDPDYLRRPLFLHPLLNRAMIAKHLVRPGEESPFGPRRFDLTKIIFPFDAADLDLGGQGLFIDEASLADHLGSHLDYGALSMRRDLDILNMFNRLPTLDPFLIREVLTQRRIDVAPCYFKFRLSEQSEMLDFVAHELEALAILCFGAMAEGDARAKRMSRLLLCDQESPELKPLREALRMDEDEFAEAMFAWKGFLYYRWKIRSLAPSIKAARTAISRIRMTRWEDDLSDLIGIARSTIDRSIVVMCGEVRQALRHYDFAFAGFTQNKDADSFRAFLNTGSRLFIDLGLRIGRLEQMVVYWRWRLTPRQTADLMADKILDALRDVLRVVSASDTATLDGPGAIHWEGVNLKAVG